MRRAASGVIHQGCIMGSGSPVRVRQRALGKPSHRAAFVGQGERRCRVAATRAALREASTSETACQWRRRRRAPSRGLACPTLSRRARGTHGAPPQARLRAGAPARFGGVRQCGDRLRDDLAGRGAVWGRARGHGRCRAGVGVGPAGRARGTVCLPRRLCGAGIGVPIANGAYQWSRRLVGPTYAWFNGWVALCAYAVANATIAYTRCGRQRWYSR
jgi:hypothetical protein